MLDYRENETIIVEALRSYLRSAFDTCEVVRQNQISEAPKYPYVSYTVISSASAHRGTYSRADDGTMYRSIRQTWSWTVQSDDQEEAMTIAYLLLDFFTVVGVVQLSDNNIAILQVSGVSSRDNFITMQYEYRNGLDVTFGLLYAIEDMADVIESFKVEDGTVEKPLSPEELNELLEKRLDGVTWQP